MTALQQIEIFSAGCPACDEAIDTVNRVAHSGSDISVLDMSDPAVATRAKPLGIARVPAVVINGQLADCCATGGPIDADVISKAVSS